ncbi:methionine adenosyltransferase [Guggenheimella bovis]
MRHLFTSESVTEGHPDKVCDQISDAILDAILTNDKYARVACECLATTGLVVVSGEVSTNCYVDIQKVVRETLKEIGYTRAKYGFDGDTCGVLVSLDEQSSDIAMGVNESKDTKTIGAGDQGMMFGYASDETRSLMPLPITLAHKLTLKLAEVRKNGTLEYLRPDGKSQVTVEYDDDKVVRIDTIVVSTQHSEDVSHDQLEKDIIEHVIRPVFNEGLVDEKTKIYVNPTGRFVLGGPSADTGLTGRKIIVDTYGGMSRHGGGAFSGKDPTKVDRSASYAARYVAKNLVASGLCKKVEIGLSYAIGIAKPTSIYVDSFGTSAKTNEELEKIIQKVFDLTPSGIIEMLDLRRPIYKQTASYGHFGREDLDLPWERLDKVEILKTF